jgi:hypothetical protein
MQEGYQTSKLRQISSEAARLATYWEREILEMYSQVGLAACQVDGMLEGFSIVEQW